MMPDPRNRYVSRLQAWSRYAGAWTIIIGAIVLSGWLLNITSLKTIVPGTTTTKPNTAVAFILAGSAVWLLQATAADRRRVWLWRACASLVGLIGLLTLSEYLFGWNLGIDELLFRDNGFTALFPGRMSPITAFNFLLLGLAILLLDVAGRYRAAQLFALTASFTGLLALLGYLYGEASLYRLANFTAIALPTAVTFVIVGLGLFLARPDRAWAAILTSDSAGGKLARRILPATVIVPIVIGWLRLLGQQNGLYGTGFGLAIFAVGNIIVFTVLIARSAGTLIESDVARRQAEREILALNAELEGRVLERTTALTAANQQLTNQIAERQAVDAALRDSEAKLRALFQVLPAGISILDRERRLVDTNPALEHILKMSKDELADAARSGRQYIHPDGTPFLPHEFPSERAFETQTVILDVEMGLELESGEIVWTSVSAAPLPDSTLGVVIVTTNITERRQAEAALARESDLLQALMDNIPDTIYFKDLASRFTRINQAQARVLGVPKPEDALGKTDADFQAPHLAASHLADERKLMETGKPQIDHQEYHPTHDGQARWFSSNKVPMRDRQGRVIGLVGVSRNITDGVQAAEAVRASNAQLTERVRQMLVLNELGEQLQSCLAIEEAYQVTAQSMAKLFPRETGALYVINTSRLLETACAWGAPPLDTHVLGMDACWALRRGRLHLAGTSQANAPACPHLLGAEPALSLCIPLLAQGETLGFWHLRAQTQAAANLFDEGVVQLARAAADSVAQAMANLNLREKLRQQSIRDSLTGLFNRRYMEESFERELQRAARDQGPVGVIMLDVDCFKAINDRHGHGAGDTVLRELGRFLKDHIRGGDIASRYGGEEFTLILPEATLDQTLERAEQLRLKFKQLPMLHGGLSLEPVTLSGGVAAYPQHGLTGELILRAADAALYAAKRDGRDQVQAAG
jgi:diguanylate cyclase (GGDEF)-like protein/PAS domain S-box-containing protein